MSDTYTQRRERRRWRCRSCDGISRDIDLLTAPNPSCDTVEINGCPHCKDCGDIFVLLCDESGCLRDANHGWPTGDDADAWNGYRNTCYGHSKA